PVTVDVELKRGVWIAGQITDKATGKPVPGGVQYFPLDGNPNLRDYPGFDGWPPGGAAAKEDGSYRVLRLPGPGLVAVHQKDPYLRVHEREDEYGFKGLDPNSSPYRLLYGSSCVAVAGVDPARGVDKVSRDVTLEPGWAYTVTVL